MSGSVVWAAPQPDPSWGKFEQVLRMVCESSRIIVMSTEYSLESLGLMVHNIIIKNGRTEVEIVAMSGDNETIQVATIYLSEELTHLNSKILSKNRIGTNIKIYQVEGSASPWTFGKYAIKIDEEMLMSRQGTQ